MIDMIFVVIPILTERYVAYNTPIARLFDSWISRQIGRDFRERPSLSWWSCMPLSLTALAVVIPVSFV